MIKREFTGQEKGADILGRGSTGSAHDGRVGTGEDVEERPLGWAGPAGLVSLCLLYTPAYSRKRSPVFVHTGRDCKCIHFLLPCKI